MLGEEQGTVWERELAMPVAINCDMGESFGLYKMGDDEGIMPFITVANVACGFHASDPVVMHKTVRLAKQHGVKIGAHPSLPDLQGFGRREMKMGREELANCILYQVGALKGFLTLIAPSSRAASTKRRLCSLPVDILRFIAGLTCVTQYGH